MGPQADGLEQGPWLSGPKRGAAHVVQAAVDGVAWLELVPGRLK
jgi:hypothetical protein